MIRGPTSLFMQSFMVPFLPSSKISFNLSHSSLAPCYAHFIYRQNILLPSQSAITVVAEYSGDYRGELDGV